MDQEFIDAIRLLTSIVEDADNGLTEYEREELYVTIGILSDVDPNEY